MGVYDQSDAYHESGANEVTHVDHFGPSLNEMNLRSLSQASSSQLRMLAASNLKYYPEHLVILIDMLKSEAEPSVVRAVDTSVKSLAKNSDIQQDIIDALKELLNDKNRLNDPMLRHVELLLQELLK